jgi:hypothetical protein
VAQVPKVSVQTVCGEVEVCRFVAFAGGAPTPKGPYAHFNELDLEDFDMSGSDSSISRSKCYHLLQPALIGQFRRVEAENLQRFIDDGGARS